MSQMRIYLQLLEIFESIELSFIQTPQIIVSQISDESFEKSQL
jgi:hypothetical protein